MNDGSNLFSLLGQDEHDLLGLFKAGNEWVRALACTLARRGVAYRLAHPERARAMLDVMSRSPLFKGGQILFDLLEWEDHMIEGPPPALHPTALAATALQRLSALLRKVASHLDGSVAASEPMPMPLSVSATVDENLPALEPGYHLYSDLVLGILQSAVPLVQAARQNAAPQT